MATTPRTMKPYRKREQTRTVLLRAGLIGPGTQIIVHEGHLSGVWPKALGPAGKRARYVETPRPASVIWEYDGNEYSLTELRDLLLKNGAPLLRGMVYEHWALADRPEQSLWDAAEEVGRDLPSKR